MTKCAWRGGWEKRRRRTAARRPDAQDRRTRLQRWADAVATLRALQGEYQDWLDNLPESLQDSALAEKLQAVCEPDLDALEDVELPLGFGHD